MVTEASFITAQIWNKPYLSPLTDEERKLCIAVHGRIPFGHKKDMLLYIEPGGHYAK